MVLRLPTVDCYSETEAEDPDEEAGSRSASVSRVTSREEVGAGQQDVGGWAAGCGGRRLILALLCLDAA